ncbi:MAG TPA: hypothetical protein VM261_38740 [Kofleriaceae bacterium]|nr:hypothetical protein [Kofleriaceae bacterium]
MGFEQVDKVAREMAAREPPPPRRRPRRGAAIRWAALVMLAFAGAVGTLYFVVGGTGKGPPMPRKGPEVARSGGGEPAPAVTAPTVQLAPTDARDARGARAAQIAVVLDDLDATLQSMRLTWPGVMGSIAWTAPMWLTAERMAQELAALDSQLSGAEDALSLRTRGWIAVARVDGARLFELQAAWSKPGASADSIAAELRPLFDRLVVASRAVHAAVAADLQSPPPGTMAALAAACRVAPLLARLPVMGAARPAPAVENAGPAYQPLPIVEVPVEELRAISTACLDESRAYLRANPGDELNHTDIYRLSLATNLAVNLLHEHDRRRRDVAARAVFISATGNIAHESALFALSRRQDDPSLRPAEAEAPPAVGGASPP